MKFFPLWPLYMAPQPREMVDVAEQPNFLLLYIVLFHRRECIITAMNPIEIKVDEVF
jgi:hypothetical protein